MIAWWWAALAWAQPAPTEVDLSDARCEPLDAVRFRDLVLQLQTGIDRGDLDLSEQVIATVRHELPCLTHAPRHRQWAAYLVGEAIVHFAKGEDWEPAMTTALRVYPAVERGVSSRHPLASWEPPDLRSPGPPVPRGATIYVDGFPSDRLPPPGEVHLVQRTDGRFWNSFLSEPGTPLPLGWAGETVQEPPRVSSWIALSGGLGTGRVRQVPLDAFDTDWVQTIENPARGASYLAGNLQGAATFYSPVGVYGRGTVTTWGDSPGLDAALAGIWTRRELLLGAGVGTTSVDNFQGPVEGTAAAQELDEPETHRLYLPRYAFGTAQLRGGTAWRYHVTLLLGGGASMGRGLIEAAVAPPSGWRVAVTLETTSAILTEQRRPANRLDVGSARATLFVGRAFGEY